MHSGFLFGVFQYRSEEGGSLIFWYISCLLFMSHIWFLSRVWMFHVTHILFLSHVAHMNESQSFQDLVLQMRCSMLCRGVLRCCALQCVAVRCSALQWVAVCFVLFKGSWSQVVRMAIPPHVTSVPESCRTHASATTPHMDESCRTYEWVVSHRWRSHVTHVNRERMCRGMHLYIYTHIYTDIFIHIYVCPLGMCMSHVARMYCRSHVAYESCHAYEQVMLHIWMNEFCPTFE